MRLRFQADEDFNAKIIAGLLRREPSIDIQTARTAGVLGLSDPQVLAIAAADGRILISHDRETMPAHFKIFASESGSPGLIIVSQALEIREVIEQVLLIWAITEADEWRNRIGYIPL
jgi:predicted nuclease of predicted toxin-antitoxin system